MRNLKKIVRISEKLLSLSENLMKIKKVNEKFVKIVRN